MTEYKAITRWTMPDSYFGETWPNYYSAGVGQSRDSDALERSNFRCMLAAIGGESETVHVVREGHWAVGWIEWIAIHQDDTKALEEADAILCALSDYPVIDDMDFSDLESEEANETWRNCYNDSDRLEYIRNFRSQFDFHDMADLRAVIRGEYFNGYASELLH
jgi:hypothetical protein